MKSKSELNMEIEKLQAQIEDYDKQLRKVIGWLNDYKKQFVKINKILDEFPTEAKCLRSMEIIAEIMKELLREAAK